MILHGYTMSASDSCHTKWFEHALLKWTVQLPTAMIKNWCYNDLILLLLTVIWYKHTITLKPLVHVVGRLGGVQTGDFGEAAFARASSSINSFSCFNISFFSSFFFGLTLMCNFFFFFRAFLTLMVDAEHTLCAVCVIHVLCTKPKVPILLQYIDPH